MINKINISIILLLTLIAFFFPTSISGIISEQLVLMHTFILIVLLSLLLILNKINVKNLIIALSINFILIAATLVHAVFLGGLDKVSWGSYLPYLSLSLLYPISFRDIKITSALKKLFVFINSFNIILGTLIVHNFIIVKNFFIEHYSMGYQQLVLRMFDHDKPVTVFGSHAIASNFFYLLFYISIQTYIQSNKKLYLLLALGDLFLIVSLKSVSAYMLFAIGVLQILFYFMKKFTFLKAATVPLIFGIFFFTIKNFGGNVSTVFAVQHNGFLGRYSSDGVFASTVDYIVDTILPIGLWFSDTLYFTDSGFLVNFLKGSIFLVIVVYLGLFYLLKHNIKNKVIVRTLFIMICLFEFGYTTLTFNRMVSFLPFILIYLNHFEKENLRLH